MTSDRPDRNLVVSPPPSISITEKHLEAVVAGLLGRRLAEVTYYPLAIGDDGQLTEKWDYGGWHEPTMGVELTLHSGHRYSAIWNNTFTEFGLKIFPKPMTDFLLVADGGSTAVSVSDHPHWSRSTGETIVAADVCWEHDPSGAIRPSALRLGFRETTVWIAAGCSAYGESPTSFRLGTNDVMVVFTKEMSSQIGIPESRPRPSTAWPC